MGDFRRHLAEIPGSGRRRFAFLGGTIGNLPPPERSRFLAVLAATMAPGDSLLLGTDLVKDPARLVAAARVTAEFDKNVLTVLNPRARRRFRCRPLRPRRPLGRGRGVDRGAAAFAGAQDVKVPALGIVIRFADGEDLRTWISAKFRPEAVRRELLAAGLLPVRW